MAEKLLYDGFGSLKEGMDAATPIDDPIMFRRSALAVNASHRGGYIHQRPGWRKVDITFQGSGAQETHFTTALFQGAYPYYPDNGTPSIVLAIGGRLYEIRLDTLAARDISIAGADYDSSINPYAYFWQCEKWLIKQNGIDLPVIWDGVSARRPLANEIKTGTCGVYAWGRNWYARPDGFTYRATDLVRENGLREDVLKETGNDFLNEGGDFGVPSTAGKIRSLFVPSALDNSLGQGPVHVGTENGVFSCNAPVDRTVWKDMTDPIQTVSLNINGPCGDRSVAIVNGDVFYRAKDGVRSYIMARREFGNWGNVPISREVQPFIQNDNTDLLTHGSAVIWHNRMIMTALPRFQSGLGVTHNSLVVMDFDLISTLKERTPPAWDGGWTGLDIHQVLTVTVARNDRCFMIARNQSGEIELWEMREEWLEDNTDVPIQWLVATTQMDFRTPDMLKKLVGGTLYVANLSGIVTFVVQYKPDDYPIPVSWVTFAECSDSGTCAGVGDVCVVPVNTPPQYRPDLQFPTPPDACNVLTQQNLRTGFRFQPIITVSGAATLKRLRIDAVQTADTKQPVCQSASCVTLAECGIYPYSHRADAEIV